DIKRSWARVAGTAQQNLCRNWQNGRLWWNDPDAAVLTGLAAEEVLFHATALYATGGMLLSGDDLTRLEARELALLRQLLPPRGVPARFEDESRHVGRVELPDRVVYCLLNPGDEPRTLSFRLSRPHQVRELWTGQDYGRAEGEFLARLPARAGRVYVA